MFDPAETLSCGCLIEWKSERVYVTPCSEAHRTVARLMRKPGSLMVVRPVVQHDHRCSDACAASEPHLRAMDADAWRQIEEAEK